MKFGDDSILKVRSRMTQPLKELTFFFFGFSPDYPRTFSVEQSGFELTEIHVSAS